MFSAISIRSFPSSRQNNKRLPLATKGLYQPSARAACLHRNSIADGKANREIHYLSVNSLRFPLESISREEARDQRRRSREFRAIPLHGGPTETEWEQLWSAQKTRTLGTPIERSHPAVILSSAGLCCHVPMIPAPRT